MTSLECRGKSQHEILRATYRKGLGYQHRLYNFLFEYFTDYSDPPTSEPFHAFSFFKNPINI